MPRCCRDGQPPKVEEGRHIHTEGSGTPQDPLIISATTALDVQDNDIFNMILDGNGTLESPWRLQVAFSPTASIDDLPDVATDGRPNGYVLTWNLAHQKWEASPPVTANAGSVLHGNGITGDGSAGSPLAAVPDANRLIRVASSGIGLSDAGINALIRHFDTTTLRDAANPAPIEGALSTVATSPGIIDQWDGSQWVPSIGGRASDIQPGQLLALSGSYSGGTLTTYVAQLTFTTDGSGAFTAIPSADLTGYSGVLECSIQPTGDVAWHPQIKPGTNSVNGVARRLDTGATYPGVSLTGTVRALLY